jgi:hypothetical protein
MIRKSTLFRLLGLAFLVMAACLGTFNLTAQPAQALQCFRSFLNCPFSHVEDFGSAICCVYNCPDGSQRIGPCQPI